MDGMIEPDFPPESSTMLRDAVFANEKRIERTHHGIASSAGFFRARSLSASCVFVDASRTSGFVAQPHVGDSYVGRVCTSVRTNPKCAKTTFCGIW
jgi:hypothetical protein